MQEDVYYYQEIEDYPDYFYDVSEDFLFYAGSVHLENVEQETEDQRDEVN